MLNKFFMATPPSSLSLRFGFGLDQTMASVYDSLAECCLISPFILYSSFECAREGCVHSESH